MDVGTVSRIWAFVLVCAVAATACGSEIGPASDNDPSTTRPAVGERQQESASTSVPGTPQATTSAAPPREALTGTVLDTQWIDGGLTQIYLAEGVPTGLTSGIRLPLGRTGDEVTSWLAFADWGDVGNARGAYADTWDGEILLLELAGHDGPWERFVVRDSIRVLVPGGSGTVAAMCFENGLPRAVELRFSDQGLRIHRAWAAALDHMTLAEVEPGDLRCPELVARPVGEGASGAIVTPMGRTAGAEDCAGYLDIGGSTPRVLQYIGIGSCLIDGSDDGVGVALSVVHDQRLERQSGWLLLQGFLGWDYSGAPLWRVLDSIPLTKLDAISLECTTDDGTPAVAEVEGPITAPTPIAAWTTTADRRELTPVDAQDVTCEYLGD